MIMLRILLRKVLFKVVPDKVRLNQFLIFSQLTGFRIEDFPKHENALVEFLSRLHS